jgi:hypothetical protein
MGPGTWLKHYKCNLHSFQIWCCLPYEAMCTIWEHCPLTLTYKSGNRGIQSRCFSHDPVTISQSFLDRFVSSEMPATLNVDEPHGSLFAYFHIFTPLVDNHVIAPHATDVTWPIPIICDHLRLFPMISDDFPFQLMFLILRVRHYPIATKIQHPRSSIHNCREHQHVGISK